jgi:2-polyprenyl-3-methyl-5-hydroxy-6-metoxy-1,4-benzoquinol methylase
MNAGAAASETSEIRTIVASYDSLLIRSYALVRFTILRQSFLDEIGQYLPRRGDVLDVGCGFGLFSLFFARRAPECRFLGCDLDARRIASARTSAERLGIGNVRYEVADAAQFEPPGAFDAIYLLDLVHHLPRAAVPAFLARLRGHLRAGGVLVLKEVEDRPAWKRWFTLLLDRLMVGAEPIHYWSAAELSAVLTGLGLDVVRHRMRDVLPYPHILYVARAPR